MWILFVWIISTICYLPLYCEQLGYAVPNVLIQIKYFFVVIPIIAALVCIKRKGNIKNWLHGLFAQKTGVEPFALCGVIAFCGVLCTNILGSLAYSNVDDS